jgi:hypothetical protein
MKPTLLVSLAATAALLAALRTAHAEPETYRSPTIATSLSLGGIAASGLTIAAGAAIGGDTGVAVAIVGAGSLLITPSAGNFYSGKYLSSGLIARAAGAAAMGIGGTLLVRSTFLDNNSDVAVGMLAFLGGSVAFVTGTILDVARAGSVAQEWNARHHLTLTPTAISTPTGSSGGLGLGARF